MNNQSQTVSVKARYVRKKAFERMHHAINTLQRNMYTMECYLEKLEVAKDDAERARVLNNAIAHLVSNIQPNLRIELLAESQAELAMLGA